MADPRRAGEVLDRLRALGVRLSLDDFGTGHSSLSYLKRLPLDEVKIDRAFVSGIVGDENDALIVRSTIDLARNLGLDVVAEGVEGADVLHRLRSLRCHEAQGFHLSRPLPPERSSSGSRAGSPSRLSRSEAASRAAGARAGTCPAPQATGAIRRGVADRVVRARRACRPSARRARTRGGRSCRCPRRRPSARSRPLPRAASSTRRSKRRRAGRAQPHRAPAPDLVERERPAQVARPPARADPPHQRARAEMVRPAGVDPLLRAGGDEPDVAAGRERGEPRRERDQRADAGRVVLRAGRGRDGVGVRHQDPEAVRAAARARRSRCASGPCPVRRSGRGSTVEAGLRERRGDAPVRPPLGGSRRRAARRRARASARRRSRGRRRRRSTRASRRPRRTNGAGPSASARSGSDGELARARAEAELEQLLLPRRADHGLAVDLLDAQLADAAVLARRPRAPRSRRRGAGRRPRRAPAGPCRRARRRAPAQRRPARRRRPPGARGSARRASAT